uniref:RING-type domain-containing protein n=1 Tax=Chrysemys picta bellii TaxID=8478 RepID=A0A8C3HM31_CHRPI
GQTKGPSSPRPENTLVIPAAMASAAPVQGIQEETKCPICLEYLTDPVTMDCGHNFCQGCISNYCDKWEEYGPLECPVCRHWIQKGNLRHNWQATGSPSFLDFLSQKPAPSIVLPRAGFSKSGA